MKQQLCIYFVKTRHSQMRKVDDNIIQTFSFSSFLCKSNWPGYQVFLFREEKLFKNWSEIYSAKIRCQEWKKSFILFGVAASQKQAMNSLLQLLKCMFKSNMFESRCQIQEKNIQLCEMYFKFLWLMRSPNKFRLLQQFEKLL